jgi:hypothetical protein
MSEFALIDNGIVISVIVADQSFIDRLENSENYVETFINAGKRKNYAGIGMMYDEVRDAFIYEKPYDSWVLNEESCQWESPIPYPNDNKTYYWVESTKQWKETFINIQE